MRSGPIRAAVGFVQAACRYWGAVFPAVCADMRRWHARAAAIPDPLLRGCALQGERKRGNMEGAAIFAVFLPRRRRTDPARAAVAFQYAYNYLDVLGEQPHSHAVACIRRLHGALRTALCPVGPHQDYYALLDAQDDAGYLCAIIDSCRQAIARLPSRRAISAAIAAAGERVVVFQSLNLSEYNGRHRGLARWGQTASPPGSELRWWETAASAGSSLGAYGMIAAAADPALTSAEVAAMDGAYFPWIGALHSLLDNLIDVGEDAATGQRNLAACYEGSEQAAQRMGSLARQSRIQAGRLPHGSHHQLVLAAMCAHYLSAPHAKQPPYAQARAAVIDGAGPATRAALLVFAVRNAWRRLAARTLGREQAGQVHVLEPVPARRWLLARAPWVSGLSAHAHMPMCETAHEERTPGGLGVEAAEDLDARAA